MILFIIGSLFMLLFTVLIITDTRVSEYYGREGKPLSNYKLQVPVWVFGLIVLLYFIPVLNIIALITFIITYMVYAFHTEKSDYWDEKVFKVNMMGNNLLTKVIIKIKKLLNKKI